MQVPSTAKGGIEDKIPFAFLNRKMAGGGLPKAPYLAAIQAVFSSLEILV